MTDQTTDRRARYAKAMALHDGHPEWPTEYEDDERDYLRRADAAIKVADAERAVSPPVDRAALRDRIAALFRHPPGVERLGDATPGEIADAVLAVLPEPADRAAEWRAAADTVEAMNEGCSQAPPCTSCAAREDAADGLRDAARRMVDEAQQPEPGAYQPRRGDHFEAWLKSQRDRYERHGESSEFWHEFDAALDRYRLHADTGTPLGEHVCEARVAGDCDGLEQPATGAQQDEAPAVRRTDSDPDRIVGYQSRGGRLLRCVAHHPGRAVIESGDFRPVTSEDLPNGGLCTYPLSLEERCGADVLIPQPAAGARQDGVQP